jgi:hypothetical protein
MLETLANLAQILGGIAVVAVIALGSRRCGSFAKRRGRLAALSGTNLPKSDRPVGRTLQETTCDNSAKIRDVAATTPGVRLGPFPRVIGTATS